MTRAPEQQTQIEEWEVAPETYESIEMASMSGVSEDLSHWTTTDWFLIVSAIIGGMVLVACFARFTRFGDSISNVFTVLANISKRKNK